MEALSFYGPPNQFNLVSERNTPGVRSRSSRLLTPIRIHEFMVTIGFRCARVVLRHMRRVQNGVTWLRLWSVDEVELENPRGSGEHRLDRDQMAETRLVARLTGASLSTSVSDRRLNSEPFCNLQSRGSSINSTKPAQGRYCLGVCV